MSYICHATKEPVPNGTPRALVPLVMRNVNYRTYEVTTRGNRLIKQYMGSSKGHEVVTEVSVNPALVDEFRQNNNVQYLDEVKNVIVEYNPYKIKPETREKLEANGQVTINEKLPTVEEEKPNWNRFSDLLEEYD